MTMRDIGEKGFLDKISQLIDTPVLDFNEDASTYPLPSGDILVINADMLVDKTDVLPGMSDKQIGKKAVTMSISDIIAKGVSPSGCLASIGFPSHTKIDQAEAIIEGIKEQCTKYNCQFLGGDLNNSEDIVIDIISFGVSPRDKLIPRKGSKEGDIIYSTGLFGLTALAFKSLLEGLILPEEIKQKALSSVYSPKPRYDFLQLMRTLQIDTCMDSSDGLFVTLKELAKINKKGINITRVPIDLGVSEYAVKEALNPLDLAFGGGEEFELVFSIDPSREEKLVEVAQKFGLTVHKIGYFSGDEKELIISDERFLDFELSHKGFEHFSK